MFKHPAFQHVFLRSRRPPHPYAWTKTQPLFFPRHVSIEHGISFNSPGGQKKKKKKKHYDHTRLAKSFSDTVLGRSGCFSEDILKDPNTSGDRGGRRSQCSDSVENWSHEAAIKQNSDQTSNKLEKINKCQPLRS